jgi:aminopeptidase N
MRSFLSILFVILLALKLSANDRYPRNFNIDILHYSFFLNINDTTNVIEGRAEINIRFLVPLDSIWLDLAGKESNGAGMIVTNVTICSRQVNWKHRNGKLAIPVNGISDTCTLQISYRGIPADGLIISKNKFGDRVFFSDHWPNRAHNYLPCIDHPYDKAAVDFIITAPSHYGIVANGIIEDVAFPLPGFKCTHWKEVVPLPVKVMSFGAADFAVNDTAVVNGIHISTWVFRENSKEGFFDYSVASKPLMYYIKNIGPYPFKKLANVQSKTIYGGLENAGAIFYSERSVTGRGRAEGLIAHEIAHQWFGDNVTEKDWQHVWLSEGFATYLTSMYFEDTRGEEYFRNDLDSTRAKIIRYYRKNKMPVIDTTITNLMRLLNTNSYEKGAWVLHMLRNEIGDDAFKKGLRSFYDRFRNSNVLTADFMNVMEEVSGRQLDDFFHQWLWTGGQPELIIRSEPGKRKTSTITITQRQDQLFKFPIEVRITAKTGQEVIKIPVKERVTRYSYKGRIMSFQPDPEVRLLYDLIE